VEGVIHTFGRVLVNEESIMDFATRQKLQFYYVDPKKAKASIYCNPFSSGWHTTAKMMRQLAQYYFSNVSSMGSSVRTNPCWLIPVRPGYTLSDRGIIKTFIEVLEQDRAVVLDMKATNFVALRS
jgi:acyl dehydratase